jgi:hypothetical protein
LANRVKEEEEEVFLEPDDTLEPSAFGALSFQGGDPFGIAEALRGIIPGESTLESEPEVELSQPKLPNVTETKCYAVFQEFVREL